MILSWKMKPDLPANFVVKEWTLHLVIVNAAMADTKVSAFLFPSLMSSTSKGRSILLQVTDQSTTIMIR